MACRLRIIVVSLLLAATELSFGVARAQVEKSGADRIFRAGAFAIDVTPTKFPVIVNGNSLNPDATTVVDPLHARCLVLDDGKTKIALVVCDLLGLHRSVSVEARRRTAARSMSSSCLWALSDIAWRTLPTSSVRR